MQKSAAAGEALARFYDVFSAGDVEAFDRGIAADPEAFVVGTQRVSSGREEWLGNFRRIADKGLRLEAHDIRAYAEGSFAWAFDRPTFVMPDGSELSTRLTAVLRDESGEWRLLHAHFSVAVPDPVAIEHGPAWLEELGQAPA